MGPNRTLQVPHDEDDLGDAGLYQIVHNVVQHRLAGDARQWLGRQMGVGAQARAPAGQGNDGFHDGNGLLKGS